MSTSAEPYPLLVFAQEMLTRYGYCIILSLGVFGNILNILIFFRKKLRTISCNNYFLASTFANLVALSVGIIPIVYVYDRPWVITILYCKARGYVLNISQQMSRFFIVGACLDQYALCSTSTRLRRFCQVRIARRYVIPSIILVWMIIPLHILILPITVTKTCVFVGSAALYNSIYGLVWAGFLPPSLMLIFSLLIFRNSRWRHRRRQQIHPMISDTNPVSTRRIRRNKAKDQQILIMLLIQVFVHVISTVLYSSNLLYLFITANNGTNKSIERRAIEAFISFITEILRFFAPFLSFYLFILMSRLFRKQVKLMLSQIGCTWLFLRAENRPNNGDIALRHLPVPQNQHQEQPIRIHFTTTVT